MRTLVKIMATGFFAMLPVLLLYLLLGQLFDMMMALTQPLMDVLPENGVLLNMSEQLRAVIMMIVLLFLVGLAALTKVGQRFGNWLEDRALTRLPLYRMLRNLAARLSGHSALATFRPVLVTTWPQMRAFAFVVEEHASGDFTVFMPIAPTPTMGFVHVVSRDSVQLLDVKANRALSALVSWGDGAEAALASEKEPKTTGEKS